MKNAGVYLDYTEDDLPRRASSLKSDDDAVLQMWGVGKEIWKEEDGNSFIARERAALDGEMESRFDKRAHPDTDHSPRGRRIPLR